MCSICNSRTHFSIGWRSTLTDSSTKCFVCVLCSERVWLSSWISWLSHIWILEVQTCQIPVVTAHIINLKWSILHQRSVLCSDLLFPSQLCVQAYVCCNGGAWLVYVLKSSLVHYFVSIVFFQIMLRFSLHETAGYVVGNDEEPFGYSGKETYELGRLQKFTGLEPSLVLVSTEMHYWATSPNSLPVIELQVVFDLSSWSQSSWNETYFIFSFQPWVA